MGRYRIIKSLNDLGLFNKLIANGIVSIDVATKLSFYEEYLKHLKHEIKKDAIHSTALSMNVSAGHMYKVIRFME